MNERFPSSACLVLLLSVSSCSMGTEPKGEPLPDRPNVLFLFADDQRSDAIGAYDNPYIQTPHIDSLVESGYSFRSNYCMGSIHGAVCQPSRAMLMSGRSLYRVPMNLKDVRTLPVALAERGYKTFGTGKWHNGGESFLRSFQGGKSVMLGGMSNHLAVPIRDVLADGSFSEVRTGDGFSSELFADAAIEFLMDQKDSEQPFFAYVAFTAPHDPRQPPLAMRQAYYDKRPPLPPNYLPQHPFHNGWMVGRDEVLAGWPRTPEVISDQLCEYYGLITHLDTQVGRILAALEASGQASKTVVIYTADHGLAVGSHGLLGKQSVYEHSMGAPLVLAGPGIPQGESDALTYLFDLYPTLCALTTAEGDASVEGQDLGPLWRGERDSVRSSLFLTYEDKMRSVRDARFKLIRYPLIDHLQLFDLELDPHEIVDLAREPGHQGHVERLWKELERWQELTEDPHPLTLAEPLEMDIDLQGRARKADRHQPQWIVDKYFE